MQKNVLIKALFIQNLGDKYISPMKFVIYSGRIPCLINQ